MHIPSISSRRRVALAAALPALALAACGAPAVARPAYHGTVTFAQTPGTPPNYIMPMMPAAEESAVNIMQFQDLVYRPLYWFGNSGQPIYSPRLSLADAPVYSNRGRTITVTLKPYNWSNGYPVTNRDVEFWIDLYRANPAGYYGYTPGGFPSNLVAMRYPKADPRVFSLTFDRAYNHEWLLYDQLSEIFPIPQHAWDKESVHGAIGNYDLTTSGARAVGSFLANQARTLSTYATNPLWRVVDGPWRLSSYTPVTGYSAFVPNRAYSGPDKPRIASFEEVPFTNDASEFDALRSGELDYGYLPQEDLNQRGFLAARGYRFSVWPLFAFNAMTINFTNPTMGPIFDQLYVRQALQRLVNQPELVKAVFKGFATADYGPVPESPPTAYLSSDELHNPYPYSPAAARALLAGHGWSVHPGGTDTCQRPGVGHADCGDGVRRGASLAVLLQYTTGYLTEEQESEAIASAWNRVGIHTTLQAIPAAVEVAQDVPCNRATGLGCKWDLNIYSPSFDWTYTPDHYPTGEDIIKGGAPSNLGGYDSATMNRLIVATQTQNGLAALKRFENYAALQIPDVWIPSGPVQLSEISAKLHGAQPQDPIEDIYPEDWTLSG